MPPKKASSKKGGKKAGGKPKSADPLAGIDFELLFGKRPESMNDKEAAAALGHFEKLSPGQLKALSTAEKKQRVKDWIDGKTPGAVKAVAIGPAKPKAKKEVQEEVDNDSSTEEMESDDDENILFAGAKQVRLGGPADTAMNNVGRTVMHSPETGDDGWETSVSASSKKDKKKQAHSEQKKKEQLAMMLTVAQLENLFATEHSHRQLRKHFVHIIDGKLDQKFQLRTFAEGRQSGPLNRYKQARNQFLDIYNVQLQQVNAAYADDSTPLKEDDALIALSYIISHCGEHLYENQNDYFSVSDAVDEGERKIRVNKPETDKLLGTKEECDAKWGDLIAKHAALTEYSSWRKFVTASDQGWDATPVLEDLAAAVKAGTKVDANPAPLTGEWLEKLAADVGAKKTKLEDYDAPWLRNDVPTEPDELKAFDESKTRNALFLEFQQKCAGGDAALVSAYLRTRVGPLFSALVRPPHNGGQYLRILRDVLKIRADGETKNLKEKLATMKSILAKEPRLLDLPRLLASKNGKLWGTALRSHPDFGALYPAVVSALKQ